MKISIRPAPHSKGCAVDGRSSCDLYQNHQEKCATLCKEFMCCEMKHCWQVGEALRDILIARGHEVKMADKKYRKGWPSEKASQHTKAAMAELMSWSPDVHVAIHTNAAGKTVTGVRIGYPDITNNAGEKVRVAESKRLAEMIVRHNAPVYHTPSNVKTTTYNFSELNSPKCPAVYIEACYANTNLQDARWLHDNIEAIARSYADGIEAWGGMATEEKEDDIVRYNAYVKTKSGGGASIWSDNKKSARVVLVPDGDIVAVIGEPDSKGFVPVEYNDKTGVFDSQYLVALEAPKAPETAPDNTELLSKLQEIRVMVDEAITMVTKA